MSGPICTGEKAFTLAVSRASAARSGSRSAFIVTHLERERVPLGSSRVSRRRTDAEIFLIIYRPIRKNERKKTENPVLTQLDFFIFGAELLL